MQNRSPIQDNDTVTGRTYNRQDNLVTSIDVPGYPGLSFSYSYDENKNVTAETTGGVMAGYSWTAGYDNEDRLISWQRQNGDSQSWTLTLVGDWQQFVENGTTQNRTHGPTHELIGIDGTGLTYDPKGNLTQDHEGKTYVWDFDNHLASVTVPAGASDIEGTHTHRYDALGRRVSKTVNDTQAGTSETTVFVCTTHPLPFSPYAGQVLAEYHSGSAATDPERKYAYGTYIDEPLVLIDLTAAGSQPAVTEELFFYHQNRLYNVTALSDSTGAVTERYAYTPYGEITFLDGSATPLPVQESTAGNAHTFTGRHIDTHTGLYFLRARYLVDRVGRFIARDPLAYIDGYDPYTYATDSPPGRIDSEGQAAAIVVEAGAGGLGIVWGGALVEPSPIGEVIASGVTIVVVAGATIDLLRRCFCKRRHPTWPKCPKGFTNDPLVALQRTVRQVPGWSGPYLAVLRLKGRAKDCPGGAPGTRFAAEMNYVRHTPFGIVRYNIDFPVNCCACCRLFRSGVSCKQLHPDRGSGRVPLPPEVSP